MMSKREREALSASNGDQDAEDRMTLVIAAEARAEQPLPRQVSDAVLAGESLLTALRKWRNLTHPALADQAGIDQGFLREIEAGSSKAVSTDTLRRLANALNVPEGWLV